MKEASGAGTEARLVESAQAKLATDWSADGRFLLYQSQDPQTGWDLWARPMEGDQEPWIWLRTPFEERFGRVEGDDLSLRIARGAIKIDEACRSQDRSLKRSKRRTSRGSSIATTRQHQSKTRGVERGRRRECGAAHAVGHNGNRSGDVFVEGMHRNSTCRIVTAANSEVFVLS